MFKAFRRSREIFKLVCELTLPPSNLSVERFAAAALPQVMLVIIAPVSFK